MVAKQQRGEKQEVEGSHGPNSARFLPDCVAVDHFVASGLITSIMKNKHSYSVTEPTSRMPPDFFFFLHFSSSLIPSSMCVLTLTNRRARCSPATPNLITFLPPSTGPRSLSPPSRAGGCHHRSQSSLLLSPGLTLLDPPPRPPTNSLTVAMTPWRQHAITDRSHTCSVAGA